MSLCQVPQKTLRCPLSLSREVRAVLAPVLWLICVCANDKSEHWQHKSILLKTNYHLRHTPLFIVIWQTLFRSVPPTPPPLVSPPPCPHRTWCVDTARATETCPALCPTAPATARAAWWTRSCAAVWSWPSTETSRSGWGRPVPSPAQVINRIAVISCLFRVGTFTKSRPSTGWSRGGEAYTARMSSSSS